MRQRRHTRKRTVSGGEDAGASARREPPRAGTLGLIARAAAHDRISAALRAGGHARGLSEQQVIELLRVRGVSITPGDARALGAHRRHPPRGGRRSRRRVPHEHRRARGTPCLAQPVPRHDGSRAARLGLSSHCSHTARAQSAHNAGVLLADLVATSAAVAATRSRLAKVAALADCLRRAAPDEIAIVVSYLSGELRQRRTGVGWAALRDLPPPAPAASLEVARGRSRLRARSRR